MSHRRLFTAAAAGQAPACRSILAAASDSHAAVSAQDDAGVTALMLASARHHMDAVQALLECGAEPNAATRKQETALMWAAKAGAVDVVHCLLAGGADPDATDAYGRTAWHFAKASDHSVVMELLEESAVTRVARLYRRVRHLTRALARARATAVTAADGLREADRHVDRLAAGRLTLLHRKSAAEADRAQALDAEEEAVCTATALTHRCVAMARGLTVPLLPLAPHAAAVHDGGGFRAAHAAAAAALPPRPPANDTHPQHWDACVAALTVATASPPGGGVGVSLLPDGGLAGAAGVAVSAADAGTIPRLRLRPRHVGVETVAALAAAHATTLCLPHAHPTPVADAPGAPWLPGLLFPAGLVGAATTANRLFAEPWVLRTFEAGPHFTVCGSRMPHAAEVTRLDQRGMLLPLNGPPIPAACRASDEHLAPHDRARVGVLRSPACAPLDDGFLVTPSGALAQFPRAAVFLVLRGNRLLALKAYPRLDPDVALTPAVVRALASGADLSALPAPASSAGAAPPPATHTRVAVSMATPASRLRAGLAATTGVLDDTDGVVQPRIDADPRLKLLNRWPCPHIMPLVHTFQGSALPLRPWLHPAYLRALQPVADYVVEPFHRVTLAGLVAAMSDRQPTGLRGLAPRDWLLLVVQVLTAVAHLEALGIAHCRVTADNVYVDEAAGAPSDVLAAAAATDTTKAASGPRRKVRGADADSDDEVDEERRPARLETDVADTGHLLQLRNGVASTLACCGHGVPLLRLGDMTECVNFKTLAPPDAVHAAPLSALQSVPHPPDTREPRAALDSVWDGGGHDADAASAATTDADGGPPGDGMWTPIPFVCVSQVRPRRHPVLPSCTAPETLAFTRTDKRGRRPPTVGRAATPQLTLEQVVGKGDVWAVARMFLGLMRGGVGCDDDSFPRHPEEYTAAALPVPDGMSPTHPLIRLLHRMVAWDAMERPTAAAALAQCRALLFASGHGGLHAWTTEDGAQQWLTKRRLECVWALPMHTLRGRSGNATATDSKLSEDDVATVAGAGAGAGAGVTGGDGVAAAPPCGGTASASAQQAVLGLEGLLLRSFVVDTTPQQLVAALQQLHHND